MDYKWTTQMDGWHGAIKADFPAGAMVYTTNMMMAQSSPLPALTSSVLYWGDISSSNVIVVGCKDHYLLAGAVTAFRSLTMLRAVYENHRIIGIEMYQPEIGRAHV